MESDFLDAHDRHWQDAEQLYESRRWANSDHLYGLAVECGLKKLMLVFGMTFDSTKNRPKERDDRQHANGIWDRYETYRNGHNSGAGYTLPPKKPFNDWDVSQRYANQFHFDSNRVEKHREGARIVQELVRKAQREGLI